MSEDGSTAIVVIALLGNPFSPAYARARHPGRASALTFCSMNVALYGRNASAWALRERVVSSRDRVATGVTIGASSMRWESDRLTVEIDERTTPFGRPLRGRVVLHPEAETELALPIDDRSLHLWWPVAPVARIEVDLPLPGVRFRGHGYHDANAGEVPLESTFDRWSWSRARTADGALLTYDTNCSAGEERSLALRVSPSGAVDELKGLWTTSLPQTRWRLPRQTRSDEGHPARLARSLEDGPFYARALVETRLGGRPVLAVHETVAAHRLHRGWVRFLTGFRMRSAS